MKRLGISVIALTITLVGCASSNPKYLPQFKSANEQAAGEVVIYRTDSLQAKLANAYVGVEEGYFSELGENQYMVFKVDPGFHLFKTRAHGSVASQSHIKVGAGESLCIEARPNYEEMEWLVIPFVNALIPSFVLEETPCPSAEVLKALSKV
ncbi:hypothetical protein Q4488_10040 [Amphritea sp. 1_MG-2023]|uniref:hypothetical protein n=1 Tax=Amphritea sp. 1_MG-2023 TaxID=3062670 RepID=UPI0026E18CF7|nr:hypothetical protein [Amphritea sp. 1_MG-2023]MDO6563725.1 hypothetical protein [Amphritea sp. 1_MG-2023]